MSEGSTYDEILAHNPEIGNYFQKSDWDFIEGANRGTKEALFDLWEKNVRRNSILWKEYGSVQHYCAGFGLNKGSILIGAGPSFNKNKHVLKEICDLNAGFDFEEQPFLLFCSNHMFKPCLKMGIIPHFVLLLDASDVVYGQLCEDIPEKARGCILLAPIRADHRVLSTWLNQGRLLRLFMGDNKELIEVFVDETGEEPGSGENCIYGGNVLNQMYILSYAYMGATCWMAVGNDLSYPHFKDLGERRRNYYADKDYSTNLATKRDEAKKFIPWMGFSIKESSIVPGNSWIEFNPVATTGQLILYKTWMETRIGIQSVQARPWHYFNCSEGGILGVLSKSRNQKEMWDKSTNNWMMLDDLFPKRWHTTTLANAADQLIEARHKLWREGILEATRIGAVNAAI